MRVEWIKGDLFFIIKGNIDLFVLEELLLGDVIEGI